MSDHGTSAVKPRDGSTQQTPVDQFVEQADGAQRLPMGEVLSRYVGQLLHGCGHPKCTESLCHYSSSSKLGKEKRRLTPRSARAIAITICLGPDPVSHICPYYNPSSEPTEPVDGPCDLSSFLQQLCDTQSVRRISLISGGLPSSKAAHSEDLARMNTNLARCFRGKAVGTVEDYTQSFPMLYDCLSWLVDRVATEDLLFWQHVIKEGVNKGRAYPPLPDNSNGNHVQDQCLRLYDALNDEQYLRLLSNIVGAIARAHYLTITTAKTYHERAGRRYPKRSLSATLASVIASSGRARPGRVLACIFWFKRLFLHHWRDEVRLGLGDIAGLSLDMIGHLYNSGVLNTTSIDVPGIFQFPFLLKALDITAAAHALLEHSECSVPSRRNILSWSYSFCLHDRITFFRTANYLKMRQAHSIAEKAELTRRRGPQHVGELTEQVEYAEEHYFLLKVSRGDTLKDTFDQLWQRRAGELLRPLRIRLGETDALEVGHDLGGVQIEFFNLICRQIFATDAQLFVTDSSTGLSFFQAASLQPLYMFEMCGLLFALAVYNGIPLPIDVKQALYWMLRNPKSASELRSCPINIFTEGWPMSSRSLRSILHTDVEGLEYSFPLKANGLRLNVLMPKCSSGTQLRTELEVVGASSIVHHGVQDTNKASSLAADNSSRNVDLDELADAWPGWHIVPASREAETITSANRQSYVKDYVSWLTFVSVAPQWSAFANGFFSHGIINEHVLRTCFSSVDLQSYVEGTKHLDIVQLRNVAGCHGYDPNSRYISWFWQIVTSWPQEKQKQLLKFVTASERLPIGGSESMTFVIKKTTPDTIESLPTSSTCFGTLYLPRYATQDILAEKLSLAVEYGMEGFGTA